MASMFVTGGSGFIGREFVRCAIAGGHHVSVLTRSQASASRIVAAGAQPVIGDLGEPGPWQDVASSVQAIVHLAQPDTYGARVSAARAKAYRAGRLRMDALLLGCLKPEIVQRILFIAGTSYYGNQGTSLRDEDTTPNPKGWGPFIAPAIEALKEYSARGLPIVEVFPGIVYGPGSWFAEYILEPLHAGKRITGLSGRSRMVSPVHVEDCARALLHLLDVGEVGRRYFVVDDRPIPVKVLSELAARTLLVPLRIRAVPLWLCRLLLGPVVTESLTSDACLSNARLRKTGFSFTYATVDEGVPALVDRWRQHIKPAMPP